MPLKRRRRDRTSSDDDDSDSLDLSFFRAPAATPEPEAIPGINRLTPANIKQLLVQSAGLHSDVRKLVTDAIEADITAEEDKVISFHCEPSNVWRKINTQYKKKKGSQQYDISFDVVKYVKSTIKGIAAQCRKHPNPETRFNGLTALRKIGKTICLSEGDVIAHEVQKHFQSDTPLVAAMCDIVRDMSAAEWIRIRQDETLRGLWMKLAELEELAEEFELFEGLGLVRGLISALATAAEAEAAEDDEDGEDEDGEDEDDEDDGDY